METYPTPLETAEEVLQRRLVELGALVVEGAEQRHVNQAKENVREAQRARDLEKQLTFPHRRLRFNPALTCEIIWDPVDNDLTLVKTLGGRAKVCWVLNEDGDIEEHGSSPFVIPPRVAKIVDQYELRVKLVKREESNDAEGG